MARTTRLMELMIKVQARPQFTVQEMADEFGVSRRTMLRDLQALSGMGVPLAATPGPHGGYMLIRSRRLLPLSLTIDEALGVLLSYEAFLQYAQSPFAPQHLSAITKLRAALPPDVVKELDRIHRHVAVIEGQRSYEAPLLADLLSAALDGAHLRVVYDSRSGVSERVIFPFGLYASAGFWYCACYDYKRGMNLSLRADRFLSITRAEEAPARPAHIPIADWLRTVERGDSGMLPLRATVSERGMKNFNLHLLFGEMEADERGGGVIVASIPESEIEWYAAQLLPLGTDLRVLSPPQLIAALRRKAREIAALYQPE
jgi:predicted DNA-binding transcriptional regulator YafY